MSDLAYLGILEAASQFASRKLSPVELCEALLARIERLDPTYHAFIKVLPDAALAAARKANPAISCFHADDPAHRCWIADRAACVLQPERHALQRAQHAPADVREIQLPSLQDFAACNRTIIGAEAYAIHRKYLRERPAEYGALARERILNGAGIMAADYIDALRWRARLTAETEAAMYGLDCAITASSLDPAPRLDDAEENQRIYPRQCRQPFNVTGQPALAMPAGFSSAGLPLAIQLVGHAWQEARVYRIAHAYEQATDWIRRRPPGLH